MSSYLGVEIDDREQDGVHTLALRGELDLAAVPSLEAEIRHLCGLESTRAIALDLGGLSFIDSTGLAAIVFVGSLCAKHGFDFELLPGPRAVQRLFETTGLLDALPFRGDAAPREPGESGRMGRGSSVNAREP
ncbi:MAG TPA: STAS domain-containing protein [Solirubrobacteraceae bacterium]|nr:STAS domain-containing protein [Solirubrobacteraceae bacterium]